MWRGMGLKLPKVVSWGITFLYVNCAWVLFRATHFSDAIKVFKGMFGFGGIVLPAQLHNALHILTDSGLSFGPWLAMTQGDSYSLLYVVIGMLICILCRNALEITERMRLNWYFALGTSLLAVFALMWLEKESTFLYFQF